MEFLRIASDPWRANISLYKNVVVAHIILYLYLQEYLFDIVINCC